MVPYGSSLGDWKLRFEIMARERLFCGFGGATVSKADGRKLIAVL